MTIVIIEDFSRHPVPLMSWDRLQLTRRGTVLPAQGHTRRSERNLHVSRISRTSASYCAAAVGPGPLVRIGGRHLTATLRPRHSHSYTAPNPPEPCQNVQPASHSVMSVCTLPVAPMRLREALCLREHSVQSDHS